MAMLDRGDLVPHFAAVDIDGARLVYADAIWQRRTLVLVNVPAGPDAPDRGGMAGPGDDGGTAAEDLLRYRDALTPLGTACVITRDPIPGLPAGGVVVADRWGEIAMVRHLDGPAALPPPVQLAEWVDFVERQCPECQGEVR